MNGNYTEPTLNLGDIATKLTVGAETLTILMLLVCIVVGVTLIVLAIGFYKTHRYNPKLVPLEKPILYLMLGIILLLVPFLGKYFGETGSPVDKKRVEKMLRSYDIDAPLVHPQDEYQNNHPHHRERDSSQDINEPLRLKQVNDFDH